MFRSRCLLIIFVAALLASARPIVAQQPAPPSIIIGGHRIHIGMAVERLQETLGSSFSREFVEPNAWAFSTGDGNIVAKVFVSNGRIQEIHRFFKSHASSLAEQQVHETQLAAEAFALLTRGLRCTFRGEGGGSQDRTYSVYTTCGAFALAIELAAFRQPNGRMGFVTIPSIQVLSP